MDVTQGTSGLELPPPAVIGGISTIIPSENFLLFSRFPIKHELGVASLPT